jgi:hypothetical protein
VAHGSVMEAEIQRKRERGGPKRRGYTDPSKKDVRAIKGKVRAAQAHIGVKPARHKAQALVQALPAGRVQAPSARSACSTGDAPSAGWANDTKVDGRDSFGATCPVGCRRRTGSRYFNR